jgi:hypothetical protein
LKSGGFPLKVLEECLYKAKDDLDLVEFIDLTQITYEDYVRDCAEKYKKWSSVQK